MATVSGSVFFSSTRVLNTGSAIANVPIVLRNTSTGVGQTVLTNSSGGYQFNNVPAGSYTLVEAWGQTGGVASPADFTNAAAISAPVPNDPPVSAVTSPPAGTNRIDSISQNTFNITVSGNITQNFTDSPVKDVPFVVNDLTTIGANLITSANNGDWGTLPAGTLINTRPATEPYPGVSPSFTYTSGVPGANEYTVSNITNGLNPSWWSLADHTSGNETGRMEVVNGGPVGNSFFSQTVSVLPNTYYLFSSWFANMVNSAGFPAGPGVKITTTGGTTIFTTGATNIPSSATLLSWNEIGSLFNTGNNTTLVVSFIDVNGGASGNDYAADDFSLVQASPNNILLNSSKAVNKTFAKVGETITYSIIVKNSGASTSQNIKIIDTIPNGTVYQTGTVKVNGVSFPTKNPSPPTGVTIPNLGSGGVTTLTFDVLVTAIPNPNPIPNSSFISYNYAPVEGGVTVPFTVDTNTVLTAVNNVNLGTISKAVSEKFGTIGDTLTYTITFKNSGTDTANSVNISDTIPTGTTFVNNSFVINGVTQTGLSPNPPGVTIPSVSPGQSITITFNVLVNTTPVTNPVTNQGKISYLDTGNTIPTNLLSNTTTTTISFVTLTSSKIVSKNFANVGDILTYTIAITNSGNATATNILFIDTIPNGTTFVASSLVQDGTTISGNPSSPGVTLPNSIRVLGTTTIAFQVQVTTIPTPNPIPNTATATSTFTIDSTTTPTRTGTSSTNTNTVNTQVNNANLGGIVKGVDKSFAICGEIITYTISIPNSGNVTATNVIMSDTVPNGTAFISNSILVNGTTSSATSPTSIPLGSIAPGGTTTVSFKVQVQC